MPQSIPNLDLSVSYDASGNPIEPSFGQTGYPVGSVAEQALQRLGGKPSLPIQPFQPPDTKGFGESLVSSLGVPTRSNEILPFAENSLANMAIPFAGGQLLSAVSQNSLSPLNPVESILRTPLEQMAAKNYTGMAGTLTGMALPAVVGGAISKLSPPEAPPIGTPIFGEAPPSGALSRIAKAGYELLPIPKLGRAAAALAGKEPSVTSKGAPIGYKMYSEGIGPGLTNLPFNPENGVYGDAGQYPRIPTAPPPKGLNLPNVAKSATEMTPEPSKPPIPTPRPVSEEEAGLDYLPKEKAVAGTFLDENQNVYVQEILKGGKQARITIRGSRGLLKTKNVPIR